MKKYMKKQHPKSRSLRKTSSKDIEDDDYFDENCLPCTSSGRQSHQTHGLRERWLLTRKTWKYMTDAGRRLIPDSIVHRNLPPKDLIPELERNFQQICSQEPRFLLWRRKCSYPGAVKSIPPTLRHRSGGALRLAKKLSLKFPRSGNKSGGSSDDDSVSNTERMRRYQQQQQQQDILIDMLQKYLNISAVSMDTGGQSGTGQESSSGTLSPPLSPSRVTNQPLSSQSSEFNLPISPETPGALPIANSPPGFDGAANTKKFNDFISETNKDKITSKHGQQSNFSQQMGNIGNTSASASASGGGSTSGSGGGHTRSNRPHPHNSLLLQNLQLYYKIYGRKQNDTIDRNLNTSASSSTTYPFISYDNITPSVLNDKNLLRRIYDDLLLAKEQQRQQFQRPLTHSNTPKYWGSQPHLNLTGAFPKRNTTHNQSNSNNSSSGGGGGGGGCVSGMSNSGLPAPTTTTISIKYQTTPSIYQSPLTREERLKQAKDNFLSMSPPSSNQQSPLGSPPITSHDFGTQTEPIQLPYVHSYYRNYLTDVQQQQKKKRDELTVTANAGGITGKEPVEQQSDNALSPISDSESVTEDGKSRRNSNLIDNDDVSQSVSDTIKRYLKMARKKPNNKNADRFQRINYDRNLRNIKSKMTELPSISDDMIEINMRGAQTDKNWIDYLVRDLKRYQKDKKIDKNKFVDFDSTKLSTTAVNDLYVDIYPLDVNVGTLNALAESGFFDQQHPYHNQQKMQKSKSSTHVGPFLAKKIWRSRSKSQTRPQNLQGAIKPVKSKWMPQGNCIWQSNTTLFDGNPDNENDDINNQSRENGVPKQPSYYLHIQDKHLNDLSDVERKLLYRVAVDKLNQLNIGVKVTPPAENEFGGYGGIANSNGEPVTAPSKPSKKRNLLIKRRAITTSLFEAANPSDSKLGDLDGKLTKNSSGGYVFDLPLEKSLANDNLLLNRHFQRRQSQQTAPSTPKHRNSSFGSLIMESLTSFSGSTQTKNTGSCESLPATTTANTAISYGRQLTQAQEDAGKLQTSFSQYDIHRRSSQDLTNSIHTMSPGNQQSDILHVPAIVLSCIKYLELHGLHTVGIFRVSTSKKRVRQLREEFDKCNSVLNNVLEQQEESDISVHDVATLLKEYLRDLPEPIICKCLYKPFVKTQKIRNRRLQLEAISHLIQLLPIAHRDTLYVLLRFLATVAQYSDDSRIGNATGSNSDCVGGNKMDSQNLATVIAPNILYSNVEDLIASSGTQNLAEREIEERLDSINVVRIMIDHFEDLFSVKSDVMDEVYTHMIDTNPAHLNDILLAAHEHQQFQDQSEEFDYTYSNTPTSPPMSPLSPVSVTSYSSGELNSSIITSPVTTQQNVVSKPKKLYMRQEFTHENNATKQIAEQQKRRSTRNSDVIINQQQQQLQQQQQMPKSILTKSGRSSSIDSNSSIASNQSVNKYQDKRQHQNSNVVSASFKIPVQVQQHQTTPQSSSAINLNEIPYIEDNEHSISARLGLNQQPAIQKSTSLFSVSQSSNTSNKQNIRMTTATDQMHSSSVISKSNQLLSNEPKLTPSITNIGGVVLRSKTADFERIGNYTTDKSTKESTNKKLTTPQTSSLSSQLRLGPLYRRRELISSQQSAKK